MIETPYNNHISSFLDNIWAENGLSKNTLDSYRSDISKFIYFILDNNIKISNVKTSDINNYIAKRFSKGISAKSNMRLISSLKKFFRYLYTHKVITYNPTDNLISPKKIKSLPYSIDVANVDKLLAAPNLKTKIGYRDKAMLELLYACGLRVTELVSLKIFQISVQNNILRVQGKGNKERVVPINDYALDYINSYINEVRPSFFNGEPTDDLFLTSRGKAMTRHAFWHIIKKYAKEADIVDNLSPHTLRHAFATHMINNGADLRVIQLLLGHTDLATTQIYTHIAKKELKELHNKHHPRA